MRVIPYILYLFLVGVHTVFLRDLTSIYTADLNLAALIVLAVALYKNELAVAWLGFFVGLTLSAGSPGHMGWIALMYAALGLVAFRVRERLNLESPYAKLLLVFCGVFLVNVLTLPLAGGDAFIIRLLSTALTGAIYTTVVGYVFILFKEGVITIKKIKSIF